MLGFESDAKVQTRVICLFMSAVEGLISFVVMLMVDCLVVHLSRVLAGSFDFPCFRA